MEAIENARIYAAKTSRDYAESILDESTEFPDHITDSKKQEIVINNLKMAEEIEAGKHDHNMTVAQRIHYYMTGDCLPILP